MQENKGYYTGLTSPGWTGRGLYVGEDCYIAPDGDILTAYDADGNDVWSWVDLAPSKIGETAERFWEQHGGTIQKATKPGEAPEIQLPENTALNVGPDDFGGSDFPDGFESGWERQMREARQAAPTWEDTDRDVVRAMEAERDGSVCDNCFGEGSSEESIDAGRRVPCPDCGGSGVAPKGPASMAIGGGPDFDCGVCGGSGLEASGRTEGRDPAVELEPASSSTLVDAAREAQPAPTPEEKKHGGTIERAPRPPTWEDVERRGREFAQRPLQTDTDCCVPHLSVPAGPPAKKMVHVVRMGGVFPTYFAGNDRGVSDPDEAKKYPTREAALEDLSWQAEGQRDKAEIVEIEDREPSGECGTCGGGGGASCPECHAPGGGIYVASRASVPERPAMWRARRAEGYPIISTWIDEAGPGETASYADLWRRVGNEIRRCTALVLYLEPSDLPLRGAFFEAGMARGLGKHVFVAAPGLLVPEIGLWVWSPGVTLCADVEDALRQAKALYDTQGFDVPVLTELEQTKIPWPDVVESVRRVYGAPTIHARPSMRNGSVVWTMWNGAPLTDRQGNLPIEAPTEQGAWRAAWDQRPLAEDTAGDGGTGEPLLFAYVGYRNAIGGEDCEAIPIDPDTARKLKAGEDPRVLLEKELRDEEIPPSELLWVDAEQEDPGNTKTTTAEPVWKAPANEGAE